MGTYFPKMDAAIAGYIRVNGTTQEKLAKKLGMSDASFRSKRLGRRDFSLSEVVALSNLLGLSLDELAADAVIEKANEE